MSERLTSATLASLLLMYKGELSLDDIRALPFVEDEADVIAIMSALYHNFDCDLQQERIKAAEIPSWKEVIRLRTKPKAATTT